MFVVEAIGPAATAGVRAGDELLAINGVPPFIDGVLSSGAVKWITNSSVNTPIQLTLHRPSTNATLTVQVNPTPPSPPGPNSNYKLLDGNVAYARVQGFSPEAVDAVLAAIADMRKEAQLRGLILDFRGNGGGSGTDRMVGAMVHSKVIGYWCDAKDHCTENLTDDSVQLLNLPVVTLTGRVCVSACDMFASAVKDLHLGALVGTRTAGEVSGPAYSFRLDDGTKLGLPKFYQIGANREIIDRIGVAPDHMVPLTADDLSAGRDPVIAKALELLQLLR
jgi:carboxyl-terminal processing protease